MFTGMVAFVLLLPLLVSGLPWTDVWGGGLKFVQEQTGQTSKSLRFGGAPITSSAETGETIPYQQVIDLAVSQGITGPYSLRPPKNASGTFWVGSATRDRFQRAEMVVDQYTGEVIQRVNFADNPIVAKVVSLGISLHQGELFGTANLVLNTIAAVLGVVLSVTGFTAWWKRRPAGALGVPAAPKAALGTGMIVVVIGLSIILPLVGASLVVALLLDWLIFSRLGWFQGIKTT